MKKGKSSGGTLKFFSIFDLVLIAMLTALSIAFKTVVGILIRLITSSVGIPGGALAGGFYMLWLPLAILLTQKRGSAFILAAVQIIIMVATGAPGSHGVWTIVTYFMPAIFVEIIYLYRPKKGYNILHFLFATILANLAGTYGSNLLFFKLSWQPLLFTLIAAAFSGALGAVIGYFAFKGIEKTGVLKKARSKVKSKVFYDYADLVYTRVTEQTSLSGQNFDRNVNKKDEQFISALEENPNYTQTSYTPESSNSEKFESNSEIKEQETDNLETENIRIEN